MKEARGEVAMTRPVETTGHYCPICGKDVTDPAFKRFGEWACSEAHAEEYVREVRAERGQATRSSAAPGRAAGDYDAGHDPRYDDRYAARASRWGWFGRRRGC